MTTTRGRTTTTTTLGRDVGLLLQEFGLHGLLAAHLRCDVAHRRPSRQVDAFLRRQFGLDRTLGHSDGEGEEEQIDGGGDSREVVFHGLLDVGLLS